MKVKIIEAIAGNADERYGLSDFSFRPGEEIELDDTLAAAWIESGRAAPVESAAVESAEAPAHHEHHHDPKAKKVAARAR